MIRSRKRYIDLAKGLAMLLVIVGHYRSMPGIAKAIIYSFHMPLFFALSGFTFRPEKYKNLKHFITEKVRTLIVPYVCLCLMVWMIRFAAEYHFVISKENLSHLLGIVVCMRLTPFYGTMWFVPALFCAEIPFYFLLRSQKYKAKQLAFFAFALYALGALMLYFAKGLRWGFDLCPMILAFLLCGYLINAYIEKGTAIPTRSWLVLLSWIVTILAAVCNYKMHGSFEMYSGDVGNSFLFLVSALGGTIGSIALCKKLDHGTWIEFIGKNSIIYYAFQKRLALPVMNRAVDFAAGFVPFVGEPFTAFILTICGACLMLAVISMIIRRWLPFVLGKRKSAA